MGLRGDVVRDRRRSEVGRVVSAGSGGGGWIYLVRALPLVVAAALVAGACEAPLRAQYVLASEASLPEGLAFDRGSDTFFATAVRGGVITRVTPLGQELAFYRHDDPSLSLMGAHVDADRGLLWVCEVALAAVPRSRVLALRIDDGRLVRAVELPGRAYCNDLVSDDAGTVYATDSANPQILKVDAEGASVFASDPRMAPVGPDRLGLTGIEVTPDGESLLVAKLMPPSLFRVRLADAGDVVAVTFTGDAFGVPGDPRFPGPDGLAFVDEALYVAHDSGVQQLRFVGDDFTRAEVRTTTAVPRGLTSLEGASGRLYAIDSDAYRVLYGLKPAEPPFAIVQVELGRFDDP